MNENEMNLTETQLRSWQPRHPSAGLSRRIFTAGPRRSATTWFIGSLAPVAACALLTLVIFNSGNGFPSGSGSHGSLAAMILSNSYLSESSQNEQNRLSSVIFDSTNRGVSGFSIGFTQFTRASN